jgi:SAM-dependent methyltransferase
MIPVSLPDGYLDQIVADGEDLNRSVGRIDLHRFLPKFAIAAARFPLEFLQPFVPDLSRTEILEIGSGFGFGLCSLLLNGYSVRGVEPGGTLSFEGRYDQAARLLRHNGIDPAGKLYQASGEALPFADATFDVVFSIAVLEHVRDPDRVMAESLRVCRPGGYVVMNVPNYDSFWEGHYRILWLPYVLDHRRGSAYVRCWGRQADFLRDIKFTRARHFRSHVSWAAQADVVKVFPFLFRPFLYVSALAYFLAVRSYERHPVLRLFVPGGVLRPVHELVRAVAAGLTAFGALMGLAPTFNVVVHKKAP